MLGALALVLLATALGAGFALSRQGTHLATAVVMLHPLEGNAYSPGGRGDDLVNLGTEAQVLRSEAVARAVLDKLGKGGDPDDLLAVVTVQVPPNTQLLEITARGPDDETATARASAFADVYLAFRKARTQSAVFEQTSRLEELVSARGDERDAAIGRLDKAGTDSPERALLEQQVSELTLQISSMRAQLAAAQAVSLDPGQVVTPGHPAARGIDASPVVMGGLAGGAVALLAAALLVARIGRRRADVVRALDDLAEVGPPRLGVVKAPVRADSDVIALVRSAVLAVGPDRPLVVAVASVGQGRSLVYRALVEAMTRARYEVVAVDLDQSEPVAALAELVLEKSAVGDVLVDNGHFLSRLRPVGTAAPRSEHELADLAASAGMVRALGELAKGADLVLVRSPGLATPVGRAVLAAASAVVAEVRAGRTTRSAAEELVAEAERVRTDIVGFVQVRPLGTGASHEQEHPGD